MDINWKDSLDQILGLHEDGIEVLMNQSLERFQSLGMPLSSNQISYFFDILLNRNLETCRKFQMTYIASMESIECVDTSNVSNEVLISVTSTPIKGQSGEFSNSTIDGDLAVENVPNANDLAVENEQNTTEEVESVSNEPNPVAESDNEQIDKEPSATGDTKLVEVDSTEPTELLAIQTESLNSEAPTIDAPVELEATATDEIQTEPIPISTKSANETEKPSEIEEQLEVENQLEIENQTDTEPIENQIETAANETDDAAPEKEPVANETVDEEKVDDEKKSDAAADSVPIVSNASPDLTVIPEVQVPAEVEPKVHADSDAADGEIELAFSECDLADEVIATQDSELANDECIDETAAQISDEIEIDEKSAIEQIKQIATDHEVEVEVEVESDSENVRSSEMVQDESNGCLKIVSVEGNSSFHDVEVLNLVSPECDEKEVSEGGELDEMVHSVSSEEPQLLTGFDKMELLQIGVRRKRSASLTLNRFDGATKKWKLEEKCPTDAAFHVLQLPSVKAIEIDRKVDQKLCLPKNDDPNVHARNSMYQTKCMLCPSTNGSSMVNHYRMQHANDDVYISRPSPQMAEQLVAQSTCAISRSGQIHATCFFCETTMSMSHSLWRYHLLSHTGELEFSCTECGSHLAAKTVHGQCSANKMVSVFDDQPKNGSIMAMMCKQCNYVQFQKSRIIRHLEHEHTTIDVNFARNIEKVVLIPDLRPLDWKITPNYVYVHETKRFRCDQSNCKKSVFPNLNEFQEHYAKVHENETTFRCPHCYETINKNGRYLRLDIAAHLRRHGSYTLECLLCGSQFDNDFVMANHFCRMHTSATINYRVRVLQNADKIERKQIRVIMQCNVCNFRCESLAKSSEHFLTAHESFNLDFSSVRLIKRTTADGITSCFMHKPKKMYQFVRSLWCAICDRRTLSTFAELVEHFNQEHSQQFVSMKLGRIFLCNSNDQTHWLRINFDQDMVFYCATCHDEAASKSTAYANGCDVHAHWLLMHSKTADAPPFRFYAVKFVKCVRCKFISTFDGIKEHNQVAHPGDPIVVSNILDEKACALCPYNGNELTQHLKTEHELILRTKIFNPIRFPDEELMRLLNINFHMKFKCKLCDEVAETKDAIHLHGSSQHNQPNMFQGFFDRNGVTVVAGCCQIDVKLHEFLDHLVDPDHKMNGVCTKCPFQTTDTFEFVNHQVDIHQITKDAESLYRRVLQSKFWSTKIVFGNGLAVTKHSILGTEYDDSHLFHIRMEELLTIVRQRLYMKNACIIDVDE